MRTPEEEKTRTIKDWLAGNKLWFEDMVVAAAWSQPAMMSKFLPILCKQKQSRGSGWEWVDDFSKPLHFAIYRAIYDFYMITARGVGGPKPITPEHLRSFLQAMASIGETLALSEVDMAMGVMEEISKAATPENATFVEAAWTIWLLNQKCANMMTRNMRGKDDGDIAERLNEARTALAQGASSKAVLDDMRNALTRVEEDVPRIMTRLLPLDVATGGGVALKESTLIIAAPGTGKTVLSCQLGSGMAMDGNRTLIISTEETSAQLAPRIIANQCNIPISLIKDGVKEELLQQDQLVRYHDALNRLTPDLFRIVYWDNRNKDIEGHFEALFDQACTEMGGPPKTVLLDWLGGALGKNESNDPKVYRAILKRGACAQASMAKRFNIHTFTFAQANLQQCVNKVRVDATMLSENKTLHEDMTNCWGITAMLDKEAMVDSGEESAVFELDQYISVSKSRRGVDRKIPVTREFLFQRFGLRRPGSKR